MIRSQKISLGWLTIHLKDNQALEFITQRVQALEQKTVKEKTALRFELNTLRAVIEKRHVPGLPSLVALMDAVSRQQAVPARAAKKQQIYTGMCLYLSDIKQVWNKAACRQRFIASLVTVLSEQHGFAVKFIDAHTDQTFMKEIIDTLARATSNRILFDNDSLDTLLRKGMIKRIVTVIDPTHEGYLARIDEVKRAYAQAVESKGPEQVLPEQLFVTVPMTSVTILAGARLAAADSIQTFMVQEPALYNAMKALYSDILHRQVTAEDMQKIITDPGSILNGVVIRLTTADVDALEQTTEKVSVSA